jgi:hypothetical protein
MARKKVKLNLDRTSVSNKLQFARQIITSIKEEAGVSAVSVLEPALDMEDDPELFFDNNEDSDDVLGFLAPASFNVSEGEKPGEAELSWDRVKGVQNYIIQFSFTPSIKNSWIEAGIIPMTSVTVNKLISGRQYWFRVAAAAGSMGHGPWSEAVAQIII